MDNRRNLKQAGAAVGAAAVAAPAVNCQSRTKTVWRLQTYAGEALAEHVIKPSIASFNEVANGEMEIELYFADQLVPTGELFRALQEGEVDAVQSDDDSIAAPVDIAVFGGYFPFATRHSLDVPALFQEWGLKEIWEEAYGEVEGVTWLSAGAWDPCHIASVNPIRSLEDLNGLRVFTFPTAGRFLSRFGVAPVVLAFEDIEGAVRAGDLDGIAWSGITERYAVGWADGGVLGRDRGREPAQGPRREHPEGVQRSDGPSGPSVPLTPRPAGSLAGTRRNRHEEKPSSRLLLPSARTSGRRAGALSDTSRNHGGQEPAWLAGLLWHRSRRDDRRCHAKYGELWEHYRQRVRYSVLPFIS